MVHISGPYYFDSDGTRNFTLYERKTVSADSAGRPAKEENLGKTYDSPLGYYPSLPALMQGYIRHLSFTMANSQEAMELAAFITKLDALTRAVSFTLTDVSGAAYEITVQKVPVDMPSEDA